MKNLSRVLVGWTAFFWIAYGIGFLLSEGEPVCEGPLITSGSDSFPPQCPEPLDSFYDFAQGWFVVLVALALVGLAAIFTIRLVKGRKTTAPT